MRVCVCALSLDPRQDIPGPPLLGCQSWDPRRGGVEAAAGSSAGGRSLCQQLQAAGDKRAGEEPGTLARPSPRWFAPPHPRRPSIPSCGRAGLGPTAPGRAGAGSGAAARKPPAADGPLRPPPCRRLALASAAATSKGGRALLTSPGRHPRRASFLATPPEGAGTGAGREGLKPWARRRLRCGRGCWVRGVQGRVGPELAPGRRRPWETPCAGCVVPEAGSRLQSVGPTRGVH